MDNRITIALTVIVVAIVAVAAFFVMNGGSDDNNDDGTDITPSTKSMTVEKYPDTYMCVLGNANLDLKIDSNDASEIQKFIDNKTSSSSSYKYEDYYMLDANFDGIIDSNDVDIVKAMVSAQRDGDWSKVIYVYYVNVDLNISTYDMTRTDKVITLIAPPLDTVLAIGGKDLVVGTDNRITTGKFHAEYETTLDFKNLIDVGSCNEPSTEEITNAAMKYGGVNVVCGTKDSYGPTMESTFKGTSVQVIRIASWEFGGTLYGMHTLGFLLKKVEGAQSYYDKYMEISKVVDAIVKETPSNKKAAGNIGAAVAYGYDYELSLLGEYTGEYANLMVLDPYDSATPYLGGQSGGHGNTITTEGISAMYQQYHLINLILMIGTPFQITAQSGDAQSTANNIETLYNAWSNRIGSESMTNLNVCIAGYSFSSGVSEVLNRAILCYYMYNTEFLAHFGFTTQKQAQDKLAEYVDWYCSAIGIDDSWSFYGEDNGGKTGTRGMNLLYCGEDDERNIMYGLDKGFVTF